MGDDTHYLAEGWLCLESPWGEHQLHSLRDGSVRQLDPARAALARRLVRGVAATEAEGARQLLGQELVEERAEPFDRVLLDRLAHLDDSFRWMLAAPQSARLLRLTELAHSLFRHGRQDLDQLPVLPETALRRALELAARCHRGPGSKVVFVGDDDLVSLPAAALGLRPTVLELDPDLTAVIELLGTRFGLDIEIRQLDLKAPLPPALVGSFDGFCTDPESTRECISLFVSRALALVRPGGVGIVACAEEWVHLLDELIETSRVERVARYRRFANYRDLTGTLSHYRSDLHVLTTPTGTSPLVPASEPFDAELFPFGLDGGDHLLVGLEGCVAAETLTGRLLPELLGELLGVDLAQAAVADENPLPSRVITVRTPTATVQATVSAAGRRVELDLDPAPPDEGAVRAVGQLLRRRLTAAELTLRALRRIE